MSYASPRLGHARVHRTARTVDLAGTAWPLYKLEALAVGVLVFLGTLALAMPFQIAALQTAVLAGAAVTVVLWWTLRIAELRAPGSRR